MAPDHLEGTFLKSESLPFVQIVFKSLRFFFLLFPSATSQEKPCHGPFPSNLLSVWLTPYMCCFRSHRARALTIGGKVFSRLVLQLHALCWILVHALPCVFNLVSFGEISHGGVVERVKNWESEIPGLMLRNYHLQAVQLVAGCLMSELSFPQLHSWANNTYFIRSLWELREMMFVKRLE